MILPFRKRKRIPNLADVPVAAWGIHCRDGRPIGPYGAPIKHTTCQLHACPCPCHTGEGDPAA